MIAGVRNLIWQCAQLFYRLETSKTMRAYVAHNMDGNEDLFANLEMTKNEVIAARKLAEEGVGPLRKAKEEKDVAQV